MKKILLASIATAALCSVSAFAADMPVRAPVYKAAPAPVFSWTGCYIGANAGGDWGSARTTIEGIDFDRGRGSSGVGGGQIGCDYQTGAWVFGVEGNFDWTGLKINEVDPLVAGVLGHGKYRWLGTATGRIGYAVDRSLLYVKGGAAWANVQYTATTAAGVVFAGPNTSTGSGWTLGGGWEYAFAPNWSAKIEYDYLRLKDSFNINCPTCAVQPTPVLTRQNVSEVLVGLNYRFGSR
jgi:outer membrane immunogenic protein